METDVPPLLPHPECLCKSKAGDGFCVNKWCEEAKFLWIRFGRGFSGKAEGWDGRRRRISSVLAGNGMACATVGDLLFTWMLGCAFGCCAIPITALGVRGSACPHRCAPAKQIRVLSSIGFLCSVSNTPLDGRPSLQQGGGG